MDRVLPDRGAVNRECAIARQSDRPDSMLPPKPLSRHLRSGLTNRLLSERIVGSQPNRQTGGSPMAEIGPLRRRMIEDMTVRNLSPATQQ
jgi:hypothetical protein